MRFDDLGVVVGDLVDGQVGDEVGFGARGGDGRWLVGPAGCEVCTHHGPDARIDETYAALGTYVADHSASADRPVRERYLAGVLDHPGPLITEIAWPVTHR